MTDYDDWIGRQRVSRDVIDPWHVAAFSAALDRDDAPAEPGAPLPCCWHWLFFRPCYRASDSGTDGHERLGAFLPPLPYPRRMWAGGRIDFRQPPHVGEHVTRISTIRAITPKHGRSGGMVFVTVSHRIEGDRGGLIEEEQDLVYRSADQNPGAATSTTAEPPRAADWEHRYTPDPVLLFRYSALTFNSHRIHYDRRYCIEEEGYPGLVVHGPLLATLLAQLAADNRREPVRRFDYRSRRPVFDTMSVIVRGRDEGDTAVLWAERPDGTVAVEATVR